MKILDNEFYCFECEMTIRREEAKSYQDENGLYCPCCEARLHNVVILGGAVDERPERRRNIKRN